jgi:hypothetical protein
MWKQHYPTQPNLLTRQPWLPKQWPIVKNCLLLAQASKNLWKHSDEPIPTMTSCDITTAEYHTIPLTGSLAKVATSLLVVPQELCLWCACNKVWSVATYFEKNKTNRDSLCTMLKSKMKVLVKVIVSNNNNNSMIKVTLEA